MISTHTLKKLQSFVGKNRLLDSPEDRIAYSYDATPLLKQLPDAVVIPGSAEEISQILRLANEERFAVVPRGSGSGLSGGSIPVENCVVLLMSGWRRILEIDEKNLSLWVEPGVITGEIHAAVEARGLFYPPDPGSSAICTIGGNVAENAGGLRGLKYGVTKNYVLGLEVVLANGDVVVTGGKSVKDVAGYSLKDFLIGSEGTLGIITRVLLRLIPKPEASRTMLAFYDRLNDAAETVSDIIASKITPAALEFLDRTTIRSVEAYAKLGLPMSIESLLLIEVDGRRSEVDEDAGKVVEICRRHRAADVRVAANEEEAVKLRAARKTALAALARVRPTTILEDVTVPRSEVASMIETINRIAADHALTFGNFGHAGDGNLHPTCLTDERDLDEIHRVEQAFDRIFTEAVRCGGTITGEHGVGLSKRKFLEKMVGEPAIEMMRKIKSSLDPNGILNPGKIFSLKPRCEGPLPTSREQIKKFVDLGAYT
jgi:glycolate oxidase